MISKNFNKRGSRCNVRKWMWPISNHAHIFEDGDIIISCNCECLQRSQCGSEEIHHGNTMQNIGSKVNIIWKARLI